MAFRQVINRHFRASSSDKQALIRELESLRAELDDIRAKFGTLLAKLDADAGVTDVNYASTQALPAAKFVA